MTRQSFRPGYHHFGSPGRVMAVPHSYGTRLRFPRDERRPTGIRVGRECIWPPKLGGTTVPLSYLREIRLGGTGVPRGPGVPVTDHGLEGSPCKGHGDNLFPKLYGRKDSLGAHSRKR